MEKTKGRVIVISCFFILLTPGLFTTYLTDGTNIINNNELTYSEEYMFQLQGINVKNTYTKSLWWLDNKNGTVGRSYRTIADNILKLIDNDNTLLSEIYGNMYVNPYNNTIFLVLTRNDPSSLDQVSKEIANTQNVKII